MDMSDLDIVLVGFCQEDMCSLVLESNMDLMLAVDQGGMVYMVTIFVPFQIGMSAHDIVFVIFQVEICNLVRLSDMVIWWIYLLGKG